MFIDGSRVVVTGEPADMIFGTVSLSHAFRGRWRRSRRFKDLQLELNWPSARLDDSA